MRPPTIPPLHPAGWSFVAAAAFATLMLGLVDDGLAVAGAAATLWCAYFFRDPPRATPIGAGLVVSPADGVVSQIIDAPPPDGLAMGPAPRRRVSIFMNVLDVHVNRAPCAGTVIATRYVPGRFLNASLDKASEFNERNGLRLDLPDGTPIALVQIAGLIARRIKSWVGPGDRLNAGERFGLIRFGSRVDLYLPADATLLVGLGQRMVAGETVIAMLGNASRVPDHLRIS